MTIIIKTNTLGIPYNTRVSVAAVKQYQGANANMHVRTARPIGDRRRRNFRLYTVNRGAEWRIADMAADHFGFVAVEAPARKKGGR